MTGTNEQAPDTTASLSQVAKPRRRVLRPLIWSALIAGIGAKLLVCTPHDPDCKAAARTLPSSAAVLVCEREYVRSGDPAAGAILADQHRRSGNAVLAAAIANGLVVTSARGEAYRVLGQVAIEQHRHDDAITALQIARDVHRAAGRHGELARDDQALARALFDRIEYAPALRAIDECLAEAGVVHDRAIESLCHVSAAHVLIKAGTFDAPEHELDLADQTAETDHDRAWLEFERGNLLQEIQRSPLGGEANLGAIQAFENALAAARRAQITYLVISAELNLAYSHAELLHIAEAEAHLAAANQLDHDNKYATERTQEAAHIAYRRNDLATALAINERLYGALKSDNDRISVSTMQARIALQAGDLATAQRWATLGIEATERVLRSQSTVELRSWVLSSRRQPYELMFVTLARRGDRDQALAVLDRWQGRALQDALSRPMGVERIDLRSAATRFDNMNAWLPAAVSAPLLAADASKRSMDAVRSTDLLALVVAERELWRVTSIGGQIDIANLGPVLALKDDFQHLQRDPTSPPLTQKLGKLLIPDSVFRVTSEALRVTLDGPLLSALPIVSLRHEDGPLIAARPVIRAPRISELGCVPASKQRPRATVLADADGDLPDARGEAQELALSLGSTASVGEQVTSEAMFGAGRSDLLHIAVHADIDASGGFLKLHDRQLHALEILARRIGPAVTVLSSCASTQANDFELVGSLASAFLAGGSSQVVATLRPVSDPGARAVTAAFYRAGGAHDPVRALAAAQKTLAGTPNEDWPNFAVLGHELCRTTQ